jgi:putative NIF3 family GTP cyclohydrolase 1 type 2
VKVLLDENMPHQLRAHLRHHETATAVYMGWGGWKNGQLLEAVEDAGFDVLVTGDLSLEYQQNLTGRRVAIVSLSSHNWRIIKHHVARIARAVDEANAGTMTQVECGRFSRRGQKPKGQIPG